MSNSSISLPFNIEHPFLEYCRLCADFKGIYTGLPPMTMKPEFKEKVLDDGSKCNIYVHPVLPNCIIVLLDVAMNIGKWFDDGLYKDAEDVNMHGDTRGKANSYIMKIYNSFSEFIVVEVSRRVHQFMDDTYQPAVTSNGKVHRAPGPHHYKRVGMYKMNSKESLEVHEYTPNVCQITVSDYEQPNPRRNSGMCMLSRSSTFGPQSGASNSIQGASIIFIGHSLGGACANLASLNFSLLFRYPNIECYTFGTPKFGDDKLCLSIYKEVPKTFCISHMHDIVPTIPRFRGYKKICIVRADASKVPSFNEKKYRKSLYAKYYLAIMFMRSFEFLDKENDMKQYLNVINLYFMKRGVTQKIENALKETSFIGRFTKVKYIEERVKAAQ